MARLEGTSLLDAAKTLEQLRRVLQGEPETPGVETPCFLRTRALSLSSLGAAGTPRLSSRGVAAGPLARPLSASSRGSSEPRRTLSRPGSAVSRVSSAIQLPTLEEGQSCVRSGERFAKAAEPQLSPKAEPPLGLCGELEVGDTGGMPVSSRSEQELVRVNALLRQREQELSMEKRRSAELEAMQARERASKRELRELREKLQQREDALAEAARRAEDLDSLRQRERAATSEINRLQRELQKFERTAQEDRRARVGLRELEKRQLRLTQERDRALATSAQLQRDLEDMPQLLAELAALKREQSAQGSLQSLVTENARLREGRNAAREQLQEREGELAAQRAALQELRKLKASLESQLQASATETAELRRLVKAPEPEVASSGGEGAICDRHDVNRDQHRQSSCEELQEQLHDAKMRAQRLEFHSEKELDACGEFVKHLCASCSSSALTKLVDMDASEIIGMGNYGYVLVTKCKQTGDRLVLKLLKSRWASVAIQEWAHGHDVEGHPHIVRHHQAVLHRDEGAQIQKLLEAGFLDGRLTGKKPSKFPDVYICLALEYMDHGTVQTLIDSAHATVGNTAAVTQHVAAALAHMHQRRQTHNDIKPENILLRKAPGSSSGLVAKLADLGMADFSVDRDRDHELFAYTVWCTATSSKFGRAPRQSDERASALKSLQQRAEASAPEATGLWSALQAVVSGVWSGAMAMREVRDMDSLQNLRIDVDEVISTSFEAHAKREATRRFTTSSERFARSTMTKSIARSVVFDLPDHDSEVEEPGQDDA